MKSIAHEVGQRLLVLGVLLCLFSVIYVLGCAGVLKTVMIDDWSTSAL